MCRSAVYTVHRPKYNKKLKYKRYTIHKRVGFGESRISYLCVGLYSYMSTAASSWQCEMHKYKKAKRDAFCVQNEMRKNASADMTRASVYSIHFSHLVMAESFFLWMRSHTDIFMKGKRCILIRQLGAGACRL